MNLFNSVFNSETPKISNDDHHHQHHQPKHANGAALNQNLSKLIIQMKNCQLVRDGRLIKDDLFIRNGRVLNPEHLFFDEKATSDMQIDCDNLIIAPGFIDVQLNGGFGKDFTNNEAETIAHDLDHVAARLLNYGVTAFCPTLISSPPATYAKLIPNIRRTDADSTPTTRTDCSRAHILGIHLEGPFISNDKPGCHDESTLQTFGVDTAAAAIQNIYGMSPDRLAQHVSIVTLAPELDADGSAIELLTRNGITVSIGHSCADLARGEIACAHGARFITHLFNAMMPFHHRDPHLIGLLSNRSLINQNNENNNSSSTKKNEHRIYYGIIADDIHTHPSAINISYKAHPHGLVLVTDSMAGMGLEAGTSLQLGGQRVDIVKDPVSKLRAAYVQGTRTLCGSVATMDECVRNLMRATGCGLVEAVRCASEHPARLLDVYPRKGSLNYGADADFVVIDEEVNVKATFIRGDLAWSANDWSPLFNYKFIP